MKVKIFSCENCKDLEGQIDSWFETKNEIKISHILQSESNTTMRRYIAISIFYED